MEREELIKLAERCEAPTGSLTLLNLDIDLALGLYKPPRGYVRDSASPWAWRKDGVTAYQHENPYTASLDAALALVGEKLPGALWCCGRMEDGDFARILVPLPNGFFGPEVIARSATPALALCAALLRALASPAVGEGS